MHAALCAEASASAAAGASLLNLLHARTRTVVGSSRASRLLQQLLAAAAAPYFEALTRWVSTGVLADPYAEFMVVEVPGMRTDAELHGESAFWAGGHRLRSRASGDGGAEEPDVPAFLAEVQNDVLKAGVNYCACMQFYAHAWGACMWTSHGCGSMHVLSALPEHRVCADHGIQCTYNTEAPSSGPEVFTSSAQRVFVVWCVWSGCAAVGGWDAQAPGEVLQGESDRGRWPRHNRTGDVAAAVQGSTGRFCGSATSRAGRPRGRSRRPTTATPTPRWSTTPRATTSRCAPWPHTHTPLRLAIKLGTI